MRWRTSEHGDHRHRRGFLVLPMEIGGEWRWFEYAVWAEQNDNGDWTRTNWVNP